MLSTPLLLCTITPFAYVLSLVVSVSLMSRLYIIKLHGSVLSCVLHGSEWKQTLTFNCQICCILEPCRQNKLSVKYDLLLDDLQLQQERTHDISCDPAQAQKNDHRTPLPLHHHKSSIR
jgi:hypothetical protein